MTNEFAIKVLTELRGYGDKFANIGFDRKEALDVAIKALEQQPCEDCVSREAAINVIYDYTYKKDMRRAIEQLPSVKPQRPKGKWINNTYNHHCSECGYGLTNETYMFYGLNRENDERHDCYCGWEDNLMNYCPCCGAEMEDSND